jgi:hydrogenase/urease accessory protein HupE
MRRAAASTTLVALSAATVAPAHAHLVETGFGAFYDGIAHVIVTPADLLVVVALALLAGQQGTRAARRAVFALPVAWLIGGLVGARWPFATALPLLTTLSFALVGALVALNARVRDAGVVAFVIIAGVPHGLVNGATMVPADAGALALGGAICAIFFLTATLSAEVTALPAGWPRIVVRVAGSWIAATGLLMLGWLARSGP